MTVTAFSTTVRSLPKTARALSIADVALAAGLLVVAVLSGVYVEADETVIAPTQWWHWGLIATPPLLVAARRRHPALITVLAAGAQAAVWISGLPEVLLPVIIVLYTAADAGVTARRVAIGASAALTVLTGVGLRVAEDVTPYQLPLVALTCGTAIVLGTNAARRRAEATELATSAAEARVRSEQEREQAVGAERSRIARELHDIIGHTLSVIAVRAEAADRVAATRPDAVAEAVPAIASSARAALDETRRVLAGLRHDEAALAPPPDLMATRRLVTDVADAGVDVTLTETGCDDHAPPATVVGGVHRILQESLTNAIKHGGPGVDIEVALRCAPDALALRVTNSLRPGSTRERPVSDDGAGLAGMAERASVLGGTFTAGADRGRFVVDVELPVPVSPTTTNGGGR